MMVPLNLESQLGSWIQCYWYTATQLKETGAEINCLNKAQVILAQFLWQAAMDYSNVTTTNISTNDSRKGAWIGWIFFKEQIDTNHNECDFNRVMNQEEQSQCRMKHNKLQWHTMTYKIELLAMYNGAIWIKTKWGDVQRMYKWIEMNWNDL